MKDHIKPTLRGKPDRIVLHVGTNDLVSDWPPDLIAKLIEDVASSMKNENHDVTVSNIRTWSFIKTLHGKKYLFNWSLKIFENSTSERK